MQVVFRGRSPHRREKGLKVCVTGSFAGQDSLGDECLLKAVLARLRELCPEARIEVQLKDTRNAFARQEAAVLDFEVARGLQYTIHRATHVLSRMRAPPRLAAGLAEHGVRFFATVGAFDATEAVRRLEACDAFLVYGGTQFSGQWFRLNAPSYMKSAEIVRKSGGRVFFGPQQFGPLSEDNAAMLRAALAERADDWRTRSPLDGVLLEADPTKRAAREIYDDVFSAVRRFPSRTPAAPTHLLFNLRKRTFDADDVLARDAYRGFARLVDKLIDAYDLPARFFSVSGSSFCDDDAAFSAVMAHSCRAGRITNIGRVVNEERLFDEAQHARLAVSMSFHGCILCGIAGAPFIPISEGNYYNYKYEGFEKYSNGQNVPIISLLTCDSNRDAGRIIDYVARFEPSRVEAARHRASDLADVFYRGVVGRKRSG